MSSKKHYFDSICDGLIEILCVQKLQKTEIPDIDFLEEQLDIKLTSDQKDILKTFRKHIILVSVQNALEENYLMKEG